MQHIDLTYLSESKKELDCPICFHKEYQIISEGVSRGGIELAYAICKQCTHIYLKYRPSAAAYQRFYASGDYRVLTDDSGNTQKLYEDQNSFKKRYSHGERLYQEYMKGLLRKDDIVFDFGAGDGAWLYGLHKITGCQVNGNEPSVEDVKFIKDKLGVDIFCGLIEDLKDDIIHQYEGRVKLVIISGSLQHMLDPRLCLNIAHKILKDDGYLYLCNKNIFVHYLATTSPYPRYFADLRTVDHPHYFHRDSYMYMVEQAGFKVLRTNDDSKIRRVHMELFGQKTFKPDYIAPKANCQDIVDKIRSMDEEVRFYRSFPQRLGRFLRRKTKGLFQNPQVDT